MPLARIAPASHVAAHRGPHGLLALLVVALAASLAACEAPNGYSGTGADGGADLSTGCQADTGCSGATPRCDTSAHLCVACLPASDNCAAGKRCARTNGAWACVTRCATATDCAANGGSATTECCDGICVDTSTDTANCGTCGHACAAVAHGTAACAVGVCGLGSCDAGYANCDGKLANGCEAATTDDPENCGGCGRICSGSAPHASATCENSSCAVTCDKGFGDCDSDPSNGCETDLSSDKANCGVCGKACPTVPNGNVACVTGACTGLACTFGWADCNNNAADGCEASLLDPGSCGQCGVVCTAPPDATAGCNAGVCGVGTCNPLYGDCDRNPANGCEKSLATDMANCGACGKACAPANAAGSCLGGQCGIVSCNAGWTDCDQDASNGCESRTSNDPMNCGGCGHACPAGPHQTATCANGVCGVVCTTGWADCNGNSSDGCEADLTTVQNCGQCGRACPTPQNGAPACSNGVCGLGACSAGWGNCDGVASDGCEKSVATDTSNCGACGHVCAFANAQAACLGGQCGFVQCNTNYADCDNNQANGCEANLQIDNQNCGACGHACGGGTPDCINGTCSVGCPPSTGVESIAYDPNRMYGYCWYLGAAGATCDQVCSELGGSNLTSQAFALPTSTFPDDCTGGNSGPALWFFQNNNACGWTGAGGLQTGYYTLGHGYSGTGTSGVQAIFYGKCATSTDPLVPLVHGTGTFPAEANNDASRCDVCTCF